MTNSNAAAAPWHGRVEDEPLLRGQGHFGDDVKPDGALSAYFVRSPHGFASIEQIDTAEAKQAPGVVAPRPVGAYAWICCFISSSERLRFGSSMESSPDRVSRKPLITVSGVRSSWEMLATKSRRICSTR